MKIKFQRYWPWLLLVLLAGMVFHASPGFDFVNWDDSLYVQHNPCVQHAEKCGIKRQLLTPYLGYPAPLTIASYRAEAVIGGPDAKSTHIVNLLLHILITLILFGLLKGLTKNTFLAFIGAAVFLVHPVTAEVVGWASDRKELLCALFSLVSVSVYQKQGQSLRGLVLSMLLWLMAVMATPTALILFLVYPVIDLVDKRISLKRLMIYGVATIIAIADVALAIRFENKMGAINAHPTALARVQEVLISAFVHAKIIFWPMVHLPKYLEAPNPQWWKLASGAIVLLAMSILTIRAIRKKKPAGLWWAGAMALYIPVSGIIPLSRRFSDSYCYPPLLFFLVGLVITVSRLDRRFRVYTAILMGLLIFAWSGMTVQELDKWQNGVRLWSLMYRVYPDSPQVCRNLGNAFMSVHPPRPGMAVKVYERCMNMPGAKGNKDFYMKNLGIALIMDRQPQKAALVLSEFLKQHPGDPKAEKYLRIAKDLVHAHPGQP